MDRLASSLIRITRFSAARGSVATCYSAAGMTGCPATLPSPPPMPRPPSLGEETNLLPCAADRRARSRPVSALRPPPPDGDAAPAADGAGAAGIRPADAWCDDDGDDGSCGAVALRGPGGVLVRAGEIFDGSRVRVRGAKCWRAKNKRRGNGANSFRFRVLTSSSSGSRPER